MQEVVLGETVYWHFAANDTSGSGGDGASAAAHVRECGAAASAAPVLSPTPSLLSEGTYPAGLYEVAVEATEANGFALNTTYAVFCTLAIDSQNPVGMLGQFTVQSSYTYEAVDAAGPAGGLDFHNMLSEMQLAVRHHWPEHPNLFTDAILKMWINAAFQEVDRKLRWTRCTYQFDTVDGQDQYEIPSRVREWLMVRYNDDDTQTQLHPMSLDEWASEWGNATTTATPTHYIHHGDKLHLYPTPNTTGDTVTMFGVIEPTNLEADADKPGFPAHMHRYVVKLAMAEAYSFMGEESQAMTVEGFVNKQVMEERRDRATERGGKRGMIQEGI